MSFAAYSILMSRGERPFVGIPVFVSRMFRHGCVFVRTDGDIAQPEDLAGVRVGIPEYQMTAVVWMRASSMSITASIRRGVRWVRGGVNTPGGRGEKMPLRLSDDYDVADLEDRSLNDALAAGEIDAMITTWLPAGLTDGSLKGLFSDVKAAEQAYYAASGIFPIMHLLVLRREVYERDPSLARALYDCFSAANRVARAALRYRCAVRHGALAGAGNGREFRRFGSRPWPMGSPPIGKTTRCF